ncbi:pyridoxal phosphate-dependent aminotransferase [Vibrio harveyi]
MAIHETVLNTTSLEFSALARTKSLNGEEIISLGLGEPGFETPKAIIDAASASMLKGENRYSTPLGLPSLRNKIESNLNIRYAADFDLSRNLIVTTGAKQALSLALTSILEPGDEIVVFSPCFVSFIPQVLISESEVSLRIFPLCDDFSLDFNALKDFISQKTKAILLNFPNNPTGAMLNRDDVKKIVSIASENDLYIISDEIYSQMVFNATFNSFYNHFLAYDKIFIIDGFSKTYSMTGWRIGYLVGPSEHIERISKIQQHTQTNVPVFIQRGAEAALELEESFISSYSERLSENTEFLTNEVSKYPNVVLTPPTGGMFAFINLRSVCSSSDDFCTKLLFETSVAATPGIIFGTHFEGFVRVSIGGDCETFRLGVSRLLEFTNTYEK